MDTDQVINVSTKETAAHMRKALREALGPAAKIRLTMSRGTGHGYMDTIWTDGPTTAQVERVLRPFQSSYFDGMDDSHKRLPDALVMVDGDPRIVRYSCLGAGAQRRYSPEAVTWAHEVMAAFPGRFEEPYDWPGADGVNHSAAHRILQKVDLRGGFPDPKAYDEHVVATR